MLQRPAREGEAGAPPALGVVGHQLAQPARTARASAGPGARRWSVIRTRMLGGFTRAACPGTTWQARPRQVCQALHRRRSGVAPSPRRRQGSARGSGARRDPVRRSVERPLPRRSPCRRRTCTAVSDTRRTADPRRRWGWRPSNRSVAAAPRSPGRAAGVPLVPPEGRDAREIPVHLSPARLRPGERGQGGSPGIDVGDLPLDRLALGEAGSAHDQRHPQRTPRRAGTCRPGCGARRSTSRCPRGEEDHRCC